MGKRIRYPKKQKEEKEEVKQEQKEQEQKKHFTLDVQNSTVSGISGFGQFKK